MYRVPKTDAALSRLSDPPRSARQSKLGVGLRVFAWIFSVVLTGAGLGVASSIVHEDQRLLHGARTTGTIVGKHLTEGSGDDSDSYQLKVRFPSGERTVTESVEADYEEYKDAAIGAATTVTYVPGDESVCRTGVVTAATVQKDTEIAALVWVFASALFLAFPLLITAMIRRQMRLLRTGRAVAATVERVAGPSKDGVRVTYRFEAQGVTYKGTTVYSGDRKRKPAAGEQITILYLPSQPTVNEGVANIRFAELPSGPLRD